MPAKAKVKAPRHSGQYDVKSRRMNRQANADPRTTCWRDGLTLTQHPPHHDGTPATWTCGHVDDTNLYHQHPSPYATLIDGRLCAPEAHGCNYGHGARGTNHLRANPQSQKWFR